MSNITQVVNVDKHMTTLTKAVRASDLDQLLSSTGPLTDFAPSDLAFGKLEKGIMEDLLKPENKTKLIDLLNCHVVAGKINYMDLKDGETLKTLNGNEMMIHVKNGEVRIDEGKVKSLNTKITNGVIHSLDIVLMKN